EERVDTPQPDEPRARLAEVPERLFEEMIDVRVLVEAPEEDSGGNLVADLVEQPMQQNGLARAAHPHDRDDAHVEVVDPLAKERELRLAALEVALAGKDVLDVRRSLFVPVLRRNAQVRREGLPLVIGERLEPDADAGLAVRALRVAMDDRRLQRERRQG